MINELYTRLNNSPSVPGLVGQDFVDPDFKPVSLEVGPQIILDTLIGRSADAKQYWLTLIRSHLLRGKLWDEPLSYFDPRGGYSLEDLQDEINAARLLKVSPGLSVTANAAYLFLAEFANLRWTVGMGDTTVLVQRPGAPPLTLEFDDSNSVHFSVSPTVQITIRKTTSSGSFTWSASPTSTLADRVETLQAEGIGYVQQLATSQASVFPADLRAALLDLARVRLCPFRAAAAALLLVGGNLAYAKE